MSTAVSSHSGAGPLSLMSCVRESSPPQDGGPEYEVEKNVSSKKKFWNPRKWFKRKNNKVSEEVISSNEALEPKDTLRSRSTSELSVSEEQPSRRRSGTPMHPGLSVSHDSIFHSPHSGSELELDGAQSSSSLSISHQPTQQDIRLQTELSERLRLRRIRGDTSEDDEGLPRSPCNSPTTTDGLLEKGIIKEHPTKSHSTCSDGSLLSMGSSEMDEDSFGLQSRHSSKLSLHEKQRVPETTEVDAEWGPSNSSAPLNHSAAHHKVSIRPRRTHGAPRRKRGPATALPTTLEVNEDTSVRSLTPESSTRETITELYTSMRQHTQTDSKIKCSSLPPGLAGPGADGSKLSRSRSNAGSKSQDPFSTLEEEDNAESKKTTESSFFGRIFPRRSKKKKVKEEKTVVNITSSYTAITENYSSVNINYEPFDKSTIAIDSNMGIRPNALRTGPASRQRVQPIDIPQSPNLPKHDNLNLSTSPLQIETRQNMTIITNSSPPVSPLQFSMSPPKSPWSEKRQYAKFNTREESKSKVRIAGLSSLQQRVLSLNDDTDNSFKSLTNLPTDFETPLKPIAKSHSFKSTKTSFEQKDNRYTCTAINDFKPITDGDKSNIFKSISLDSVQNADEKLIESCNESVVFKPPDPKTIDTENDITISGPSHKAIVSISSNKSQEVTVKEQTISVTKIQVKRDNNTVLVTKTPSTPEFFNFNLNKLNSPKMEDVQKVFQFEESTVEKQRKFSNDNIEVVKMEEPVVTVTPNRFYKKHSESMKRGVVVVPEKPMLKVKSNSFDADSNKSSQNSLDKVEAKSHENLTENVIMRKKSIVKHKNDEEPELMKVFARRSLKLKDSDSEVLSQQVILMVQESENNNKSRDSDKENLSDSSPLEERKKTITQKPLNEKIEVTLRKPMVNNKFSVYQQRTHSLNVAKVESKVLKQITVVDRPKTETWYLNKSQEDNKDVIAADEIITNLSEKTTGDIIKELNVKPKNFNQRKAEWEKRAQEALRKTSP